MGLDNKLKLIFPLPVLLMTLFILSGLFLSSHFTGHAQADTLTSAVVVEPEVASKYSLAMRPISILVGSVLFFEALVGKAPVELPITIIWLVMGAIYITLKTNFIKLRGSDHRVEVARSKYDGFDQTNKANRFRFLRTALSSNVGLGSIAGVAVAVSLGGPGAAFWIIIAGLIWMLIKFSEASVSRKYSEAQPDGKPKREAVFYLSKGLAEKGLPRTGKILAGIFAVFSIGCALVGGCAFQVNQSLNVLTEMDPALGAYPWVYGLLMALFVAAVTIGKMRRIASAANSIVPIVCGLYLIAALLVLLSNFWIIPGVFKMILTHAFSAKAVYGGIIGALLMGCDRTAFPNQDKAASIAKAGSFIKSDFPSHKGLLTFLELFIDRVTICAMTALVIVISGPYNDQSSASLITASNGAALTSRMMGEHLSWFPYLFSIAVLLFAYSSLISWAQYAEQCWMWMFGDNSSILFRMIFLMFTLLGSVVNSTGILILAVVMVLGMVLPKMAGFAILTGYIKRGLQKFRMMKEKRIFDRQKPMELRQLPRAA